MLTADKIRSQREQLGYTQSELANRSGLSLRRIQQIESGKTVAKGHTLRALRTSLGIPPEIKFDHRPDDEVQRQLKIINLATLVFLVVPYGNLILPGICWNQQRKSDRRIDETGRSLLNNQILWSLCISVLLIISPFLQLALKTNFSIIFTVLIAGILVNLFLIGKAAFLIRTQRYDRIRSIMNLL